MASGITDKLENYLIDFFFRAQALTTIATATAAAGTGPATLYVGLFTSAPTDTGGGTEVSGGAYARVAVTSGTTAWANTQASGTGASTGTGGQTSNSSSITFPTPSGANWGTVTSFGLFDASTSGNLLVYGDLTVNKTVNNGDPAPLFAAGALTFTIG
jgi:hypothetical protein